MATAIALPNASIPITANSAHKHLAQPVDSICRVHHYYGAA